jgi:hypothetical protein
MFGVSHRGLLAKTYQDAPGRKPEVSRQPRAPSPEARAEAPEAGRQPASLEWCQGELHLHDHDGGLHEAHTNAREASQQPEARAKASLTEDLTKFQESRNVTLKVGL